MRTLREGDRDAFIRYFALFRAPVFHFAWRLLRDDAAAAGATSDALTAAFRRAILDHEVDDLQALTFRCALEACEARPAPVAAIPGGERPGAPGAPGRSGEPEEDAARRRFAAALDALERRQCAALLLHDLQGMDAARSARVFGIGAEEAATLLFRAREEFREALQALPGHAESRACRQAEEALAGSVGLGLDQDGLGRLRRHAAYCRSCRRVMKGWTAAGAGLAAVLTPPPLPEALAAAPVFGDRVDGGAPDARRAGPGALVTLPLARAGRAIRSRAAAWVITAACLALAGGLVAHGLGLRPVVLMQSVGPAIRLIVVPPPDGSEPAAARGSDRETTTTTTPVIGISAGGAAAAAAAGPAGPAQSGASPDGAPSPASTPSPETAPTAGGADREAGADGEADDKEAKADRKSEDKEAKADRKAEDKEAKADRKAEDKAEKSGKKDAKADGKASRAGGKSHDRDAGKKSGGKKDRGAGKKSGGKKAG